MKHPKLLKYHPVYILTFAAIFGVIGFLALRESKAAVSADFNSDGIVNIIDLSILGTNYSKSGMTQAKGDANGDGVVNIIDLSILGNQWGSNPEPEPTGPSVPAGYSTYFIDNFDGSSLDTTRWKAYNNVYGNANNEEACLTPNNIVVSDGTMKIVSKRETIANCPNRPVGDNNPRYFTSGFIGSREASTPRYYPVFARYEIRAKLPHGQGLWPAFWLRHVNGSSTAEIDTMEYFHAQLPGKVSQTIHLPAEVGSNLFKKNTAFEAPTDTPDWHTYGVEFVPLNAEKTQAKIVFYVDGTQTGEYTPTAFGWLNNFDKNAMFDIAINDAVGGNWNGHPDDPLGWSRYLGKCLNIYNKPEQPCNPTGGVRAATFPGTYEVDYVRILTPN